MQRNSTADSGICAVCRLPHQRSSIHCATQNENPPRISPGGPTSSAPSQLPVHPRSAALSRATVRNIGFDRDESMTASCRADRCRAHLRGAFACASGHELVSSIWSNNLYGESNVEWCQDRSCCCLRALHRWSWRKRDASASSRARMGGGCSGFQGTLGLRVRGANLGASASRGPAGLRRARMRYPGNSAGSLPRLCGEPCGRILIWRRPRSHAERGPLHGPVRMRAGRAGSNVPSREGALRVTDRDIRAGCVPARTSQRASTHGGRT